MNKLILLVGLLLFGCSTNNEVDTNTRLYVLDCGYVTVSDISVFSPGHDKGKSRELVDSCYLIRHPKGDFLWDTGLPDSLGDTKNGQTSGIFHTTVQKKLVDQLIEIGLTPKDIEKVGVSHFHFDHTGNLNLFNGSEIIIQKEEFDAAFGPNAKKFGFNPDSYNEINKDKVKVINGDYDVFGDGSVVIIKTTGHTPGHQSLLVRLKKQPPIILTGDVYHFQKNRQYRRIPSFNFNVDQTRRSFVKIDDLLEKEGATLWIQHDKDQRAKRKMSPTYYY